MNALGNQTSDISQELLEVIKSPGAKEVLEKWAEETMSSHENPLIKKAGEYWLETQAGTRWPEPVVNEKLSFSEMLDRAMQENVSQAHYLTALRGKADGIAHQLELGRIAGRMLEQILHLQDQPPEEIAEQAVRLSRSYVSSVNYINFGSRGSK